MAMQTEQASARRFTVAEYHRMGEAGVFGPDERVELVRGLVIPVSPKSLAHSLAVQQAFLVFRDVLHQRAGVYIETSLPLRGLDSDPQPDVLICSNPALATLGSGATSPLLVLEVSASSLAYDLSSKAGLYAEAGIPEYWVVNLLERVVMVMLEPSNGDYASRSIYEAGTRIVPSHWPELVVEVDALLPDVPEPS